MVSVSSCPFGGPLVCSAMMPSVYIGYRRMQGAREMAKPTFDQLTELHNQAKGDSPRITRQNLTDFLRNPDRKAMQFPSAEVAAELGYEVLADVVPSLSEADAIEYVLHLEGDEPHVPGKTLRGRAVTLEANYGLLDTIYLRDNPHLIPAKFQGKKVIVFTGTLLRGSDGLLYVAYLYWRGGKWVLNFSWVGRDFGDGDVLPHGK